MKSLVYKSFFMIFLIVMIPITISSALADTGVPTPAQQCIDKSQKGKAFVDFMDNGVMHALDIIATTLYVIATVVNTIDFFITLFMETVGIIGPSPGDICCTAGVTVAGAAVCAQNRFTLEAWEKIKNSGILAMLTNFATCACCSGKRAGNVGGLAEDFGTQWGICPLGNLFDSLSGALQGSDKLGADTGAAPTTGNQKPSGLPTKGKAIYGITGDAAQQQQPSQNRDLFADTSTYTLDKNGKEVAQYGTTASGKPNEVYTNAEGSSGGISQFHISAFDNIYLAVGCLCPVAILFNLRKLKLIYQVHNCCVEEACTNGYSTESCDKQFDEASCMYWEGSAIKMLISIIASIIVGYIAKSMYKLVEDTVFGAVLRCVLLATEFIEIPGRIQTVLGIWPMLQQSFKEPNCKDLGFNNIKKQLESGPFSQSQGVQYTMSDTNGNGIYNSATPSTTTSTSTTK